MPRAPRESKAQRLAREAAELKERNDKVKAEYPLRLLAALEGATAEGWTIRFFNGNDDQSDVRGWKRMSDSTLRTITRIVRVEVRNTMAGYENLDMPSLPPEDGYECELPMLEAALRDAKEHRERMERREQLRKDARSKLTDEEADALGLSD